MNNVWPRKFKPRNGDLGCDRLSLNQETTLQEIGKRKQMKSVLKQNQSAHLRKDRTKRFLYQVLTALPWGSTKGQRLTHKNNLSRYGDKCVDLAKERTKTLNALLGLNADGKRVAQTLESQWKACKELNMEADILNTLLKEFAIKEADRSDNNKGLQKSGFFDCDETGGVIKMKEITELTIDQRIALVKAIDFYLHFEYVEKLRYEQYGLYDFYWALRKEQKKRTCP